MGIENVCRETTPGNSVVEGVDALHFVFLGQTLPAYASEIESSPYCMQCRGVLLTVPTKLLLFTVLLWRADNPPLFPVPI